MGRGWRYMIWSGRGWEGVGPQKICDKNMTNYDKGHLLVISVIFLLIVCQEVVVVVASRTWAVAEGWFLALALAHPRPQARSQAM